MPETYKTPGSQDSGQNNGGAKNDAQSATAALKQAEQDIKKDPDPDPKTDATADLDEGELARFEGEQQNNHVLLYPKAAKAD